MNFLWSNLTLPKSHNLRLIMNKTSDKSWLSQNTRRVFLKTIKVIENKESPRKCHSQEKPKET